MDSQKRVAELLKQARKFAGFTQRDLADRIRSTHSSISRAEKAQRQVRAAYMLDWLAACGLDIRVTRSGEPELDLLELTVEDIRRFVRFVQCWPDLHPEVQAMFRLQIDAYSKVEASSAEERPEGDDAPRETA